MKTLWLALSLSLGAAPLVRGGSDAGATASSGEACAPATCAAAGTTTAAAAAPATCTGPSSAACATKAQDCTAKEQACAAAVAACAAREQACEAQQQACAASQAACAAASKACDACEGKAGTPEVSELPADDAWLAGLQSSLATELASIEDAVADAMRGGADDQEAQAEAERELARVQRELQTHWNERTLGTAQLAIAQDGGRIARQAQETTRRALAAACGQLGVATDGDFAELARRLAEAETTLAQARGLGDLKEAGQLGRLVEVKGLAAPKVQGFSFGGGAGIASGSSQGGGWAVAPGSSNGDGFAFAAPAWSSQDEESSDDGDQADLRRQLEELEHQLDQLNQQLSAEESGADQGGRSGDEERQAVKEKRKVRSELEKQERKAEKGEQHESQVWSWSEGDGPDGSSLRVENKDGKVVVVTPEGEQSFSVSGPVSVSRQDGKVVVVTPDGKKVYTMSNGKGGKGGHVFELATPDGGGGVVSRSGDKVRVFHPWTDHDGGDQPFGWKVFDSNDEDQADGGAAAAKLDELTQLLKEMRGELHELRDSVQQLREDVGALRHQGAGTR